MLRAAGFKLGSSILGNQLSRMIPLRRGAGRIGKAVALRPEDLEVRQGIGALSRRLGALPSPKRAEKDSPP